MMHVIEGRIKDRQVFIDGKELLPEYSQTVYNHSPDGFYWGYSGSGPAQLALAILCEYTCDRDAFKYHQHFKSEFISKLDMDMDFVFSIDVSNWLKDIQHG